MQMMLTGSLCAWPLRVLLWWGHWLRSSGMGLMQKAAHVASAPAVVCLSLSTQHAPTLPLHQGPSSRCIMESLCSRHQPVGSLAAHLKPAAQEIHTGRLHLRLPRRAAVQDLSWARPALLAGRARSRLQLHQVGKTLLTTGRRWLWEATLGCEILV